MARKEQIDAKLTSIASTLKGKDQSVQAIILGKLNDQFGFEVAQEAARKAGLDYRGNQQPPIPLALDEETPIQTNFPDVAPGDLSSDSGIEPAPISDSEIQRAQAPVLAARQALPELPDISQAPALQAAKALSGGDPEEALKIAEAGLRISELSDPARFKKDLSPEAFFSDVFSSLRNRGRAPAVRATQSPAFGGEQRSAFDIEGIGQQRKQSALGAGVGLLSTVNKIQQGREDALHKLSQADFTNEATRQQINILAAGVDAKTPSQLKRLTDIIEQYEKGIVLAKLRKAPQVRELLERKLVDSLKKLGRLKFK